MKTRCATLVLAVLALCHCSNCPNPDSTQAKVENALSGAAYFVANSTLGQPFAGPSPALAGTQGDCRCSPEWGTTPEEGTAALWSPPRACPATAADGACPACVSAHCCAETLACVAEDTCTCLMAKEMQGPSWPDSVACGAEDVVYAAEYACLADSCAKECLQ